MLFDGHGSIELLSSPLELSKIQIIPDPLVGLATTNTGTDKMAKSRLDLRREVEAAEAVAGAAGGVEKEKPKRKKAAKRKSTARRTREKAPERKRAVWVVYDGSMKEHGRFAYDEKDAAEEKLEALRQRGKKLYFMQMVKELLTADAQAVSSALTSVKEEDDPIQQDDKETKPKKSEDGLEFEEAEFAEEEDDDDDDDDDEE